MSKKVLARYSDYNGHPNVLFMMKSDDPRLPGGSMCTGKVTIVSPSVIYNHKNKTLTAPDGLYTVHSDWSLRKI